MQKNNILTRLTVSELIFFFRFDPIEALKLIGRIRNQLISPMAKTELVKVNLPFLTM
jgi:hypothetical protein